jgi:hypothetical protein
MPLVTGWPVIGHSNRRVPIFCLLNEFWVLTFKQWLRVSGDYEGNDFGSVKIDGFSTVMVGVDLGGNGSVIPRPKGKPHK